jgi:hypothetical protein
LYGLVTLVDRAGLAGAMLQIFSQGLPVNGNQMASIRPLAST